MRLFPEEWSPWTSFDIVRRSLELELWSRDIRMKNVILQPFFPFDSLSLEQKCRNYTLVTRVTTGADISFPFDVAPENSSMQVSYNQLPTHRYITARSSNPSTTSTTSPHLLSYESSSSKSSPCDPANLSNRFVRFKNLSRTVLNDESNPRSIEHSKDTS